MSGITELTGMNQLVIGNQNIDLTGELLGKVESLISGKVETIQQSISGSKDWVVTQVKSELGSEYQKIIANSNDSLAIQLNSISIFVPIIVGIIGWFFLAQINNIKNIIEEKEQEIKELNKDVIKYKNDIQNFLDEKETEVFDKVMQKTIDNYYNRVREVPRDIETNLFPILTTLNNKYVNDDHFYILLNIYRKGDLRNMPNALALIYQFFPEKVFTQMDLLKDYSIWSLIIEKSLYDEEILSSTKKIITYIKESKITNYDSFLLDYFQHIYEFKNRNTDLISQIQYILNDGFEKYQFNNFNLQSKTWKNKFNIIKLKGN